MKPLIILAAFALGALVHASADASDSSVEAVLKARFEGDRTGACVAAAVIAESVQTGFHCADDARRPDADTTFEIGSISKTMNGLLLAGLVETDALSLDDPISEHLPEGTTVPEFEAEPIRVRHLLTHTAGLPALPPGFAPKQADNPYADLTVAQLLTGLGKVTLTARPGTNWAYSNFGAMVLSLIVTRTGAKPYSEQMKSGIFEPLGMAHAHLGGKPATGASSAHAETGHSSTGHLSTGQRTSAWDFPEGMGGVGAVRASLSDMVAYLQAQLNPAQHTKLEALIARTHEVISEAGAPMAWGWIVRRAKDGDIYAHEGGTGGFSSLAMFQPKTGKAVVILSDTALTNLGGLGDVAEVLLGGDPDRLAPRKIVAPSATLLEALTGDWLLQGTLPMTIRSQDGVLFAKAQGQSEFALGYDTRDQFFARDFDAILVPTRAPDGEYSLMLRQGGGAVPVTRATPAVEPLAMDPAELGRYVGAYPLAPGFVLNVFVKDEVLHAQATGQGAFALVPEAPDVFTARAFGIEIRFERDEQEAITALVLRQGGHDTRAVRQ